MGKVLSSLVEQLRPSRPLLCHLFPNACDSRINGHDLSLERYSPIHSFPRFQHMSPALPHAFRSFDAFDHRHSRLVMNQGIYGLFFFRLLKV